MKTIIAGSRTITNTKYLIEAMEEIDWEISEIISGRAKGVDRMGELFAETMSIPLKLFPAEWKKYGKAAGPIRNNQMRDYAEALIAIWDGKSKGTKHMIDSATKAGLKVFVKII